MSDPLSLWDPTTEGRPPAVGDAARSATFTRMVESPDPQA